MLRASARADSVPGRRATAKKVRACARECIIGFITLEQSAPFCAFIHRQCACFLVRESCASSLVCNPVLTVLYVEMFTLRRGYAASKKMHKRVVNPRAHGAICGDVYVAKRVRGKTQAMHGYPCADHDFLYCEKGMWQCAKSACAFFT
jgi:hypothetical protein